MSRAAVFVGLDVAKASLDLAVRPTGETWSVANEEAGVAQLVTRLRTPRAHADRL